MQHPAKCPICLRDSCELVGEDFVEFTSIIEHNFCCPNCDTEWKVPFVMIEKLITKEGEIPTRRLP